MSLADIALGAGRASAAGGRTVVDIVTFIEAPWGLNMRLFPIQKVILKSYYGLELESKTPTVTFTDWRRSNERLMTEADYLRLLFNEGRCNVKEITPGIERTELVLSIGRRAGKCVVGDTLVLTDGGICRIDELGDVAGPEFQPLDIGVAQEGGRRSRSAYFYNGGVQPTFRVRTHAGAVIEGTGKHRIKVQCSNRIEWRRLDELTSGDTLCVAVGSNLWGSSDCSLSMAFSLGSVATKVPRAILRADPAVVRSFLRGIQSTSIYGDRFVLNNLSFAQELRVILLNFGVLCSISMEGSTYQLCIDPAYVSQWQALLSEDVFVPAAPTYAYDTVVSIEHGEAPVFDLNVPNGASFVANGMTNHNTTMSACIAAYETYRLINKGDPQGYYGLPASNNIQLISVATDKDQAGLLYQEVSGHFKNTAFFAPYTANNTQSYARFQSPKDIERYGSYRMDPTAKATLKITFRSCVAKGLRGAGNIVIILDEVAHFTDDGQSSAESVYNAVVPSAAAFSKKDPKDPRIPIGPVESKIINISSPLGKQGLFYKLYSGGFETQSMASNRLCIQAPSWEVNPTIPASFFEGQYIKDARVFFTEYGAEFSDRTRGWIADSKDLLACVSPTARPIMRAPAKQPHFAGIDVALVGDYTTIAIGHINEQQQIVTDRVEGIRAGEGDFEDVERLEFTDVADWIADWAKQFYIVEGLFDQWLGIPLEQALQAKGLSQFKSFKSSPQITSQMYQNFKDMMFDKRLVLYNWPLEPGQEYCHYIQELLELQAEVKSKYVTLVQAPQVAGKHDDHADALVRMVMAASQGMAKYGSVAGNRLLPGQKALVNPVALRRKMMQTGSNPDRQVMPGGVSMSHAGFGATPSRFMGGDTGISGRRGAPSSLERLVAPPWRRGR